MMDKIRILLVDDHALFREGVKHTLTRHEEFEVVAEAGDAASALDRARAFLPDIVLLDINLPDRAGVDVVKDLQAELPYCKVIMLTMLEDNDSLMAAITNGARGYVLKGVAGDELARIVLSIHAGETYVTPAMAAQLLTELAHQEHAAADPHHQLTEREHAILELVADGKTNKEIGAVMFLTEKTVKHYMTNILQKLQVRNRVEAALKARDIRPH
ncbi:MAG: response regulator transcription factor [Chloroflexi bacterium]|nr:response regulator transcription factor [Chloroflexota bacterium]